MSSDEEEYTPNAIPSILEFEADDGHFKRRVPVSRRVTPPREDDPDKASKDRIMVLLENARALKKLEQDENYRYSEEKHIGHSEYKKMLRMIDELESLQKKFDQMFNTRGVVNPYFIVITHIRPKMCLNNEDSKSVWLTNKEKELISFKKD